MFLGAFVLAYGVSIYGIATKNKWGYLVSGAVAIVDMSLITVSGAEMTYNMGALIGDLAILLLSVVEYMKKGKTKEKATGKKKR